MIIVEGEVIVDRVQSVSELQLYISVSTTTKAGKKEVIKSILSCQLCIMRSNSLSDIVS